MKTTNWKFLALAFAVSTSVFTSCGDDDDPNVDPNLGGEDETSYVLDKDITEDTSLEAGKTYTLSGGIHVVAPATLNIPEGVTIVAKNDDQVDYILVEQGAKINAQGTAEKPIVMTSDLKEPGAWGGVHICGYAHTNASGGTGKSEIGDANYGVPESLRSVTRTMVAIRTMTTQERCVMSVWSTRASLSMRSTRLTACLSMVLVAVRLWSTSKLIRVLMMVSSSSVARLISAIA